MSRRSQIWDLPVNFACCGVMRGGDFLMKYLLFVMDFSLGCIIEP